MIQFTNQLLVQTWSISSFWNKKPPSSIIIQQLATQDNHFEMVSKFPSQMEIFWHILTLGISQGIDGIHIRR